MRVPLVLVLIATTALLAGCHEPLPPADNGVPPENGDGDDDPPAPLRVEVLETPTTAVVGMSYLWSWEVTGPDGQGIPHTAIHYGNMSVPTDPSPQAYAHGTNAPEYYSGTVPQIFNHEVVFEEAGTMYYRAHAVVGGTHFWTEERTIQVTQG